MKTRADGEVNKCPRWQDHDVATAKFTQIQLPAAPTFSPQAPRIADEPGDVTISAEPGTQIRYTINGAEPSLSSSLYSRPIHLSKYGEYVLRARAFKGNFSGPTAAGTFTLSPPVARISLSRGRRYERDLGLEEIGPGILRFFPDLPWPGYDSKFSNSLRSFTVSAVISPPLPNVRVYFQVLDVDDRESSIDIDGNSTAGGDNIGDIPANLRWTDGYVSTLTNSEGVATVPFFTSFAPGDNYRFVATSVIHYLYASQDASNPNVIRDSRGDLPSIISTS